MGIHRGVAIVLVLGAMATPAAAERQHLDDLGIWVEPPGDMVLRDEDGLRVGNTTIDGNELVIEIRSEDADLTGMSREELAEVARSYISAMTTGDITTSEVTSATTELHGRELVVVTAVFGGAEIYSVFFPTAERLVVVEWITQKHKPLDSWLIGFLESGIAFDDGPPGFPTSVLAEQLILAASGRAGFKKVADSKVKIIDGHGDATTVVRKKVTQAVWDERLAVAFAAFNAGGHVYCKQRKQRNRKSTCTVQGDGETVFVFGKGKKPKLTEIRLPLRD